MSREKTKVAHQKSGANKTYGHGVVSSRVTDPVQSILMQFSDVDANEYNSDDICQEFIKMMMKQNKTGLAVMYAPSGSIINVLDLTVFQMILDYALVLLLILFFKPDYLIITRNTSSVSLATICFSIFSKFSHMVDSHSFSFVFQKQAYFTKYCY